MIRLGTREFETFTLIYLDLCVARTYVERVRCTSENDDPAMGGAQHKRAAIAGAPTVTLRGPTS